MAKYQVFKETALPGTLVANGIYLVTHATNPALMEMYVSDSTGTAARRILNEADINALIAGQISGLNELQVVADITARDALTPTQNVQVLVVDATGDATVDSGAATYFYDFANTTWIKISEAESMDLTINWSDIVGGPTSTPAQIDGAVTNSHTHANKTTLDKFGEDGNNDITYDGDNLVCGSTPAW